MGHSLHKLTDRKVAALAKNGRHSDGGGLYVRVSSDGRSKSFIYRWIKDGKATEISLGAYPALSLFNARNTTAEYRSLIANGDDPRTFIKQRKQKRTFEACAAEFLTSIEGAWKNDKHRAQWHMTLGPAYCSSILQMPVDKITTEHVLAILRPIWLEKAETAYRLRGRIERVLSFAKARKWRSGENPAVWRDNLAALLPSTNKVRNAENFAAIDYEEQPGLMAKLRECDTVSAAALRFLTLTAARTQEVRLATWGEFNLEKKLWVVPAKRMKNGKEHRVPLSDEALEILFSMIKVDDGSDSYVFPGMKSGKPMSDMTMLNFLKGLGRTETVHGQRSAFRDWVGDETEYPDSMAEFALSHTIDSKTEAAYRRRRAVEKRRRMMQDWATFCGTLPADVG